jgi:hypothetical protein
MLFCVFWHSELLNPNGGGIDLQSGFVFVRDNAIKAQF